MLLKAFQGNDYPDFFENKEVLNYQGEKHFFVEGLERFRCLLEAHYVRDEISVNSL